MKYAIIGQRKEIIRVLDSQPLGNLRDIVELTDTQVEKFDVLKQAKKLPIFYNNTVTSIQDENSNSYTFRWNSETKDYVKTLIPIPVPKSIKAWQARAIMKLTPYENSSNVFESAINVINTLPNDKKIILSEALLGDAIFNRHSDSIKTICEILGISGEQIDTMFIEGAKLSV